jgi:hypothetical protein
MWGIGFTAIDAVTSGSAAMPGHDVGSERIWRSGAPVEAWIGCRAVDRSAEWGMHMRTVVFALLLLLVALGLASAQSAQPPGDATKVAASSDTATGNGMQMSGDASPVSGYRVAAISFGAAAGVLVVEAISGGMATPVVLGAGGGAAVQGGNTVMATAMVAMGAWMGGAIGNWLYEKGR